MSAERSNGRSAAAPRPVERRDNPGVIALIDEVFGEYGFGLELDGIDAHLNDPGPYFRARGGEFWVVQVGGVIRATAAVVLHADAGELRCLYVHRDLRRQGWGRRLTRMTIDCARRAGRQRFFLWTDTRFVAAHALYRSMGFEQRGQRELGDSAGTREVGFELPPSV